jgi:hypothetical protein
LVIFASVSGVEFDGFAEIFAALDDPVPDAGNFREILDDLIFLDRVENQLTPWAWSLIGRMS